MPEPVVISDYDPLWPEQFEQIRATIAAVLGDVAVAIEHVGSTAVPGLAAKPIIDINVAVASDVDIPKAIQLLSSIGYVHEGDLGIRGREAFKAPVGTFPHHLYVCTRDAEPFRRMLMLRDRLRADPPSAQEYGKIKKELARRFRDDRRGYTEAKSEFIERVLSDGA
jgi:GrpB-like predicted nucleotidyltransferase (UPF0157 family)